MAAPTLRRKNFLKGQLRGGRRRVDHRIQCSVRLLCLQRVGLFYVELCMGEPHVSQPCIYSGHHTEKSP